LFHNVICRKLTHFWLEVDVSLSDLACF
jgi:hypothetical protein